MGVQWAGTFVSHASEDLALAPKAHQWLTAPIASRGTAGQPGYEREQPAGPARHGARGLADLLLLDPVPVPADRVLEVSRGGLATEVDFPPVEPTTQAGAGSVPQVRGQSLDRPVTRSVVGSPCMSTPCCAVSIRPSLLLE